MDPLLESIKQMTESIERMLEPLRSLQRLANSQRSLLNSLEKGSIDVATLRRILDADSHQCKCRE